MYLTWYQVLVKTGSVRDAGTDANVYIRINGTAGYIEKELDNKGIDDFVKGRLVDLAISNPALNLLFH